MTRAVMLVIWALTGAVAARGADVNRVSCPPAISAMKDAEIRLSYGGRSNQSHVTFSGTGHGHVSHELGMGRTEAYDFAITDKDFIDILNRFYQAYFFDLADSYGNPNFVVLKEDGTIDIQYIAESGASGTGISLKIGDCVKRTSYNLSAPSELLALARFLQDFPSTHRLPR